MKHSDRVTWLSNSSLRLTTTIVLTNVAYSSKIYYHTSFQGPNVSGANVNYSMTAMLVLLIAGNEVQKSYDLWWHDLHTKFHEDPSVD
jgi:hypothetical protein